MVLYTRVALLLLTWLELSLLYTWAKNLITWLQEESEQDKCYLCWHQPGKVHSWPGLCQGCGRESISCSVGAAGNPIMLTCKMLSSWDWGENESSPSPCSLTATSHSTSSPHLLDLLKLSWYRLFLHLSSVPHRSTAVIQL